ncbi:hypothetical protein [Flavobacterium capsici]|uniref:Uncharacterized protein n=1 Tax=Flavobacterium capsici TaxID=3075618 RepID=A0AA96EYL2_9FLAO|nr:MULTISPECIES: hypothetical protein [unclassified Flavobacterium]WNM19257.1 hypothetical protein RN608_00910 [Flavobacterium sp. PMR2A8]WNM20646.1 hypothetical protein RN605_08080 [Flavobacterium sp. PMTSA4]
MYFTLITVIAYFFAICFIALLIKSKVSVSWFKNLWQQAINLVESKQKIKREIAKAEAKGQKPFTMHDGTTIYARTQAGAIFKHRELKRKNKLKTKNSK